MKNAENYWIRNVPVLTEIKNSKNIDSESPSSIIIANCFGTFKFQ